LQLERPSGDRKRGLPRRIDGMVGKDERAPVMSHRPIMRTLVGSDNRNPLHTSYDVQQPQAARTIRT